MMATKGQRKRGQRSLLPRKPEPNRLHGENPVELDCGDRDPIDLSTAFVCSQIVK